MTLVPDVASPVAGWRVWTVADRGRGPELVSPVRPMSWIHREPATATCLEGCAACPSVECRCGLYATAGLAPLVLACRRGAAVLGCTALWGRVVEHTDGWRGEHGYPLVLFVMSGLLLDPVSRIRSTRRVTSAVRHGLPSGHDHVTGPETLARELARLYAVPAHPAPGLAADRLRGWARSGGQAADAVRSEAADGLAGRRLGDPAAHARLARRAQELVDAA
ncbi:hypothetical protein [Actinomycetospora sp. TBRC 11914]|uniref:hypothetical protein n=1 Tax=Actinomycetospora sp. TBRC 11914 TaxID=2729387 RepID=UPI00145DA50B|nr:hypothetical protein [Actinomycetospora sp. TBRC 11914]NMO93541.1 hypothetical protein [Actinomycetospora sp. TBRC 11914]